ncbi:hypothetical protein, partial [Bradyrhizobium elkanii]|uniref:hypothetical protein n=1 Tax=Bradyrhizobium elkanii TaxID=29448 RepID=UPI001AEC01CE
STSILFAARQTFLDESSQTRPALRPQSRRAWYRASLTQGRLDRSALKGEGGVLRRGGLAIAPFLVAGSGCW